MALVRFMEKNISIDQDIEEKTSQPMAWDKVLFLQVNRINEAMTQLNGNFMNGIEALDMDLAFFHDKEYHKDMASLEKEAKDWLETQTQLGGHIPENDYMASAFARAKVQMKILLRLMGRCGFYPESQGAWKGKV